jgi:UDP-glucose 4-epimerase
MTFLITGGAGSVGRHLTLSLLEKGHRVRVLDKDPGFLMTLGNERLELVKGGVEDRSLVKEAVEGMDVIVHLAWSFADDPLVLLESDLKGHAILLDAASSAKVSHFFYTSTAVIYGRPTSSFISEESPCLVEDARKPFYGIAKLAAEKLAIAFWKLRGLPATVFRFWWSFGRDIGGRHLRDMIKVALSGQPLIVLEGAGGSFLHLNDLTDAVLLTAGKRETFGEIFNLSTIYLDWADVARIIIEVTGSSSPLEVVPAKEWRGTRFLGDTWKLSTEKARRLFHYQSLPPAAARQSLKEAVALLSGDLQRVLEGQKTV